MKKGTSKYSCRDGLFSEMTEEGRYWLGFCAADGHVCKNTVQVQLAARDRDQLERFQKALQTERPIYDYWNRKFPKSSLYTYSARLASDLRDFGIGTFMATPPEMQRHLVRGLFDGDGSISCHDYDYDGVKSYHRSARLLGSEPLLRCIQSIVSRRSGSGLGHIHEVQGIFEWSLGGADNIMRFRDWLYEGATVWMPRKRDKFVLLDRPVQSRRARNF